MIKNLIFISFSLWSFTLYAQNDQKCSLKINFTVHSYDKGKILFALYNSAKTNHKVPIFTDEVKIKNKKGEIFIPDLPLGFYSFSYVQDINLNSKLDTNFIGIPVEPYGFSNNQRGRLGPPSFEKSKIYIDENKQIEVNLH